MKLNKVVITSVSNITEPNLSNSQMNAEDITHLENRESYVHRPKYKTDFRNVLMPNNEDQQNPCWRLPTADSTHLQAGEHETHHVAGCNTVHVDEDFKDEDTFTKAVQPTHSKGSEAYEVTCQTNDTIKTHLKKVKNADTESVDTNLDNPQKKTLNESQHEAVTECTTRTPRGTRSRGP